MYDLLNNTGESLPLRWSGAASVGSAATSGSAAGASSGAGAGGYFVQGQVVVQCDSEEEVSRDLIYVSTQRMRTIITGDGVRGRGLEESNNWKPRNEFGLLAVSFCAHSAAGTNARGRSNETF